MNQVRAVDADSLYLTATCLTEASNSLADLVETLSGLLSNIVADGDREVIRRSILRLSSTLVTTVCVYELSAARYEGFRRLQGIAGVADPELLSAYIDPPVACSAAERQSFRLHQRQTIRYDTQAVGLRSVADVPRAV